MDFSFILKKKTKKNFILYLLKKPKRKSWPNGHLFSFSFLFLFFFFTFNLHLSFDFLHNLVAQIQIRFLPYFPLFLNFIFFKIFQLLQSLNLAKDTIIALFSSSQFSLFSSYLERSSSYIVRIKVCALKFVYLLCLESLLCVFKAFHTL